MRGNYALTPSQTVGPFFHHGLLRADAVRNVLAPPGTEGRIRIEGHVYDGERAGVPDAIIEIWQADGQGRYHYSMDQRAPPDPRFLGYGRSGTGADGAYWFETIQPGRVPFDQGRHQAPHICVAVFARGLLNHLFTRIYFVDEPASADDPLLRSVPAERRETLLAQRQDDVDGAVVYRFDIVLQGAGETVFFNC